MKRLVSLMLITSCIQTDFEDPFSPSFMIDNSISEIDFRVDGSYALSATYTDHTGEPVETTIAWESSDTNILSFSGNTATVHAEGLVLINASTNGLSASRSIETLASRGSLQISGFTPQLQIGSSTFFKFNFIDIEGATDNTVEAVWSSSNSSIAKVNDAGEVTAIRAGETDISVMFSGANSTTKLIVSDQPVVQESAVRITQFVQFLSSGDNFLFKADFYGTNGTIDSSENIAWSSSNPSIISINADGLASAKSTGSVTISAVTQKKSAFVTVSVESSPVTSRSGTLMGTGYNIKGDFKLAANSKGELILTITGYVPDGPGPYFYLTNQNSNINNSLSLGEARQGGDISINISAIDPTVKLSTYNFLVVWCKSFNVRLGFGVFDD